MENHAKTVQSFIDLNESPEAVRKLLWELLSAAMYSEYADDWDKNKRADILLLYEQLGDLAETVFALSGPLLLLAEKADGNT